MTKPFREPSLRWQRAKQRFLKHYLVVASLSGAMMLTLRFSLKEIEELLALRLHPSSTCSDVRNRAAAKMADIERQIQKTSVSVLYQVSSSLTVKHSGPPARQHDLSAESFCSGDAASRQMHKPNRLLHFAHYERGTFTVLSDSDVRLFTAVSCSGEP
jgi:hypothetical protein